MEVLWFVHWLIHYMTASFSPKRSKNQYFVKSDMRAFVSVLTLLRMRIKWAKSPSVSSPPANMQYEYVCVRWKYECIFIYVHVWTHVRPYVCTCVCMHICMYIRKYVYLSVCRNMCVYVLIGAHLPYSYNQIKFGLHRHNIGYGE